MSFKIEQKARWFRSAGLFCARRFGGGKNISFSYTDPYKVYVYIVDGPLLKWKIDRKCLVRNDFCAGLNRGAGNLCARFTSFIPIRC